MSAWFGVGGVGHLCASSGECDAWQAQMSPIPHQPTVVRSMPHGGQAPMGAQGCRRLQVCVRRRRGNGPVCSRRLCGAGVFAHVQPGGAVAGGVHGGDACVGGRLRLCRWQEARGVLGFAPVWSRGARESRHHPCMSLGAHRVHPWAGGGQVAPVLVVFAACQVVGAEWASVTPSPG